MAAPPSLYVSRSWQVVKPDDVLVVPDEGMPLKANPMLKGRLFLKIEIIFPTYKQVNAKHDVCRANSLAGCISSNLSVL